MRAFHSTRKSDVAGPRTFRLNSRLVRDRLQHVPVLDNSATAVEAEDVDLGVIPVAGPMLETVKHDEIAIGEGTFDLDTLARILAPSARNNR